MSFSCCAFPDETSDLRSSTFSSALLVPFPKSKSSRCDALRPCCSSLTQVTCAKKLRCSRPPLRQCEADFQWFLASGNHVEGRSAPLPSDRQRGPLFSLPALQVSTKGPGQHRVDTVLRLPGRSGSQVSDGCQILQAGLNDDLVRS